MVRVRLPLSLLQWSIALVGSTGFAMVVTSLHRWDWLYADPTASWRRWQGLVGIALCAIASAGKLWDRKSPYGPDRNDDEALTTLGLDEPADTSN